MPSSSKKRSSESLLSPESPISSINAPQFSQTTASSALSCPQALQGHKRTHLTVSNWIEYVNTFFEVRWFVESTYLVSEITSLIWEVIFLGSVRCLYLYRSNVSVRVFLPIPILYMTWIVYMTWSPCRFPSKSGYPSLGWVGLNFNPTNHWTLHQVTFGKEWSILVPGG